MEKALEDKLFKDFPRLYRGTNMPITTNLMPFGFEHSDGWFQLLYDLSTKLNEIQPPTGEDTDLLAVQVKEKFGTLRYYVDFATEKAYDIIHEYEDKSSKICEYCGSTDETVKTAGKGWIKTVCDKCRKEMYK